MGMRSQSEGRVIGMNPPSVSSCAHVRRRNPPREKCIMLMTATMRIVCGYVMTIDFISVLSPAINLTPL